MTAELATTLAPADDEARLLQAEALVRGYCGWHIAPSRTETVTLRGGCSAAIVLPSLHVTDVASVSVEGTVLDPSDYTWTGDGVIHLCGHWHHQSWGRCVVVVEFTHGYTDVPADVTGAVQAVAQRGIDNPSGAASYSRTDGPFADAVSFGSGRVAMPAGLDRYRLPARP